MNINKSIRIIRETEFKSFVNINKEFIDDLCQFKNKCKLVHIIGHPWCFDIEIYFENKFNINNLIFDVITFHNVFESISLKDSDYVYDIIKILTCKEFTYYFGKYFNVESTLEKILIQLKYD